MITILIIILIIFALGGLPQAGIYQGGYGPSSLVTILVIILIVMLVTGRL